MQDGLRIRNGGINVFEEAHFTVLTRNGGINIFNEVRLSVLSQNGPHRPKTSIDKHVLYISTGRHFEFASLHV